MKVLLVRPDGSPDDDARELSRCGMVVVSDPFISVRTCNDDYAHTRALELLSASALHGAWFVLTSASGLRAMTDLLGPQAITEQLSSAQSQGTRFAAVGPASAAALRDAGINEILVPHVAHTAAALLDALADVVPATAVLPRSSISAPLLTETLDRRGWTVIAREIYETTTVVRRPHSADALSAGEFDVIVLRSPSAARAVAHFSVIPPNTAVVAGGQTTASAARSLGFRIDQVSADSRAGSIAAAVLATSH